MIAHPGLLNNAAQIAELAAALEKKDIIAFDTEFIRETTFYPVVEIIQVATDEESWLIDARAFHKQGEAGSKALEPLWAVFRDPKILKIVHAAQGDQECIYTSFGAIATPSLDTAVAASLCGYGEGVGLGNLLKAVLDVSIKKGHARTDWSVRPLPPQLAEYAHVDVEYLVPLGRKLIQELDALGRKQWALELSAKWEDKRLYEPQPEEIALKLVKGGRVDKKGYAALLRLIKWREDRVRSLNVPRRWVADDNVLLDLSHVRPKDMAHLSAFRGLNKGELRNSGETILAAIKEAAEAHDTVLPKIPKPDIPNPSESQVLDLLKCYIGILADRYRIASKHLIGANQMLALLRSKAEVPQDLVDRKILTDGAARLIGEEVIAMMKGKRALGVEGSRVRIVESGRSTDPAGK